MQLSLSDIDRGLYEEHALILARHPSETDLRLLLRVIVFALNAHEHLQFTKGLSDVDEPDLWQIDLTGRIENWIEMGHPTEKRIRQSCSKSDRVSIYTYQRGGPAHWFKGVQDTAERFDHLAVTHLAVTDEKVAERMTSTRTMDLTCVIDDGRAVLSGGDESLEVELQVVKSRRQK